MPITARRRALRPRVPEPPGPRELRIEVADHLAWARGIARGVREDWGFAAGSFEEGELEGVALLRLSIQIQRFDESRLPAGGDLFGAVRGYSADWIRSDCRREAIRLKLYRQNGLAGNDSWVAGKSGIYVLPLPVSEEGDVLVVAPEPESERVGKRRWCAITGEEMAREPRLYPRTRLGRRLYRILLGMETGE